MSEQVRPLSDSPGHDSAETHAAPHIGAAYNLCLGRAEGRPNSAMSKGKKRVTRASLSSTLALTLAVDGVVLAQTTATLPRVRVLATGGTIAGAQATTTDYGYKSGAFDVEDLIKAVPNLDKLANVTGEQVANIGSQDMNDEVWLKLAKRVNEVLAAPDMRRHRDHPRHRHDGGDGLLPDLVVKSDKPVVLVGSMRPATAISADGPGNLYNGVAVAADPGAKGRGVLVVLNDEIHSARNVTKTDTTSVETFQSLEPRSRPAWSTPARSSGSSAWTASGTTRPSSRWTTLDELPRVDIIYAHANMSADLIDAAAQARRAGHRHRRRGRRQHDGARARRRWPSRRRRGRVVVRSTRLPAGMVLRNNEVDDDKLGFVASGELNPRKSRVLLQLALTKTKDPKQIQEMFRTY